MLFLHVIAQLRNVYLVSFGPLDPFRLKASINLRSKSKSYIDLVAV